MIKSIWGEILKAHRGLFGPKPLDLSEAAKPIGQQLAEKPMTELERKTSALRKRLSAWKT